MLGITPSFFSFGTYRPNRIHNFGCFDLLVSQLGQRAVRGPLKWKIETNPAFHQDSATPPFQFQVDGRLLEIVEDAWKREKLPEEDIAVPLAELPDPEADNGAQGESMKEQENKWTDLGLNQLAESTSANANT